MKPDLNRILSVLSGDIGSDARTGDGAMALVKADCLVAAPAASREHNLVARARGMEAEAWDEIYTAHYAPIFRYCAYRTADATTAEDLAAEVFLEAVRGIGRYQSRGTPFRAWLYRIAHNLTADEHRRRAREGAAALAGDAAGPPDFAAAVAQRRDIQVALAKLTTDQQQVIILRFLEGLSLNETAAVLGRPAGAIKSLQHRAVGRLRTLLEGEVV